MEQGNRARRLAINEVKAILEASKIFQKVEIGNLRPLSSEDTFPSAYIIVDGTTARLNGNFGVAVGCEYDMFLDVRIIINMEVSDPLDFMDMESDVVYFLLRDSLLWNYVLDRDYIGSGWDNDGYYPKKQGELGFSIKFRSEV